VRARESTAMSHVVEFIDFPCQVAPRRAFGDAHGIKLWIMLSFDDKGRKIVPLHETIANATQK